MIVTVETASEKTDWHFIYVWWATSDVTLKKTETVLNAHAMNRSQARERRNPGNGPYWGTSGSTARVPSHTQHQDFTKCLHMLLFRLTSLIAYVTSENFGKTKLPLFFAFFDLDALSRVTTRRRLKDLYEIWYHTLIPELSTQSNFG
jgi:hypothetical protein